MGFAKCTVCERSEQDGVTLHYFPANQEKSDRWQRAMFGPDYPTKNLRGHRICSRHFKPESYVAAGVKRLVSSAMPTLHPFYKGRTINVDNNTVDLEEDDTPRALMKCPCAVLKCPNRFNHKLFYRFPTKKQTCLEWIMATGNRHIFKELMDNDVETITQKYVVCEDHFTDRDFRDRHDKRKGVHNYAVPSLKVWKEPLGNVDVSKIRMSISERPIDLQMGPSKTTIDINYDDPTVFTSDRIPDYYNTNDEPILLTTPSVLSDDLAADSLSIFNTRVCRLCFTDLRVEALPARLSDENLDLAKKLTTIYPHFEMKTISDYFICHTCRLLLTCSFEFNRIISENSRRLERHLQCLPSLEKQPTKFMREIIEKMDEYAYDFDLKPSPKLMRDKSIQAKHEWILAQPTPSIKKPMNIISVLAENLRERMKTHQEKSIQTNELAENPPELLNVSLKPVTLLKIAKISHELALLEPRDDTAQLTPSISIENAIQNIPSENILTSLQNKPEAMEELLDVIKDLTVVPTVTGIIASMSRPKKKFKRCKRKPIPWCDGILDVFDQEAPKYLKNRNRHEIQSYFRPNRHLGDGPFLCHLCGRQILGLARFKRHLNVHGCKNKSSVCSICGEIVLQINMWTHKRRHQGIRYPCDICDKTFSCAKTLRIHKGRLHGLGLADQECDICGKCFMDREKLYVHKRSHTKPAKCMRCPMAFPYRGDLKRHLRAHDKGYFPCEICGKMIQMGKCMDNHLRKHQKMLDKCLIKVEDVESE